MRVEHPGGQFFFNSVHPNNGICPMIWLINIHALKKGCVTNWSQAQKIKHSSTARHLHLRPAKPQCLNVSRFRNRPQCWSLINGFEPFGTDLKSPKKRSKRTSTSHQKHRFKEKQQLKTRQPKVMMNVRPVLFKFAFHLQTSISKQRMTRRPGWSTKQPWSKKWITQKKWTSPK